MEPVGEEPIASTTLPVFSLERSIADNSEDFTFRREADEKGYLKTSIIRAQKIYTRLCLVAICEVSSWKSERCLCQYIERLRI